MRHLTRLLVDPPPWTAGALCAQVDPAIFFPDKGAPTGPAKSVCGRCDVRAECLAQALADNEEFGVWGGMSVRERRRLGRVGLAVAS